MIETQKSRARWEQDHKAAADQLRATPLGGLARPAVRAVQEQQPEEPQPGKSATKTSWYQKNKEKLKAARKQYRLDQKKKYKK